MIKRYIAPAVLVVGLGLGGLIGPAQAEGRSVPTQKEQVHLSFAPLVKQTAPAVVNIYAKRVVTRRAAHPFINDPFFRQFFGDGMPGFGDGLSRQQVEAALGSGLIVDPSGIVVTNAHVVRGGEDIRVVLADGREFAARVSLSDDRSDLAVLRIEGADEDLPFARLRESEDLQVGDLVLAIGNPFGVGQTVTSGIVSALARSSLDISDFNFFIQTDAAINPGNSGGPLVAMDGGVVGINTAIYSQSGGSLGIGFAIPSEMVRTVIAAESGGMANERGVVRPWLGVSSQRISRDIADSLGLKSTTGTLITAMHPASPLAKAGVKIGDVILSLNGRPIKDAAEMKYRMATVKLGSKATIGVFRDGRNFDVKFTAMAPPEQPPRNQTTLSGGVLAGAVVANINPAVANETGVRAESGVVVIGVEKGSVAARFLVRGDIVLQMNGVEIKTVADLQKAAGAGAGLNLVVNRNGTTQQFVIR